MTVTISDLADQTAVKRCLRSFQADVEEIVQLAIDIQQIPAPTFAERARADYVEKVFQKIPLSKVYQDSLHNVYGCLLGNETSAPVVVSAHLDTVFPADTDLKVRAENRHGSKNNRIYGPGIADNALGVAGLIALAQALTKFKLSTAADIWFVANVGEEGLGDLNGMRMVVDRFGEARSYLAVEGGSYGNIFNRAIGVRRFKIDVSTPGGHSWGDFGTPSAVHILGRIIADIDKMPVPVDPKSSINIGVIEGGTSVNTIAASASCLLDLRSLDKEKVESLSSSIRQMIVQYDNEPSIKVSITKIGERPSGYIDRDSIPVSWAAEALRYVGCKEISFLGGSTDANIPISRGYPAVCIGLANAGNTHRLDEFLEPMNLARGLSQLLLLTLAAAGY
ncbi:MAG: M20/M25/M40 family metallo-hydrolase [Anaerolineae bacterium]|nr:MAG: M20/M25/M40 family metallo-hydrolase [Anaerolineae bacterium]